MSDNTNTNANLANVPAQEAPKQDLPKGNYDNPKGKAFRDKAAPEYLTAELKDETGKVIANLVLTKREFSSGSQGYGCSDKIVNPANPIARYQCGFNATLVGSKPDGVTKKPAAKK